MKKHFSMAVVTVKGFKKVGFETDKNGKQNVYLQIVSGKIPSKAQVLSGTIAANEGLEIGSTYAVNIVEIDPSEEYGRQFQVSSMGKLNFSDILSSVKELGTPVIVDMEEKELEPAKIKDIE